MFTMQHTKANLAIICVTFCICLASICFAQIRHDVQEAAAAAPAPGDCSDCFCQCENLTYRDRYGNVNGNCKSYYNGGQWCYVRSNIGNGYSTCPDQQSSVRFNGRTWSYHACVTPALTDYRCQYCQGRRYDASRPSQSFNNDDNAFGGINARSNFAAADAEDYETAEGASGPRNGI